MTAESTDIDLFDADVVLHEVHDEVSMTLYSNLLFHVVVPPMMQMDMKLIEKGIDFIRRAGGDKYFNIFEFSSFSDVTPEVREWASDDSGNSYTLSDAIIISSLPQKILADFYLKFNKPVMPTKIFYSRERAAKWTKEQMKKREG